MPDNATIHQLFNELHKALEDRTDHDRDLALLPIQSKLDALHHDFANIAIDNAYGIAREIPTMIGGR